MRGRRGIMVGAALAAVLGVVLILWMRAPRSEPGYEGKTLSQWLDGHLPYTSADPPYNSPGWKKADEALRQIGTNGVAKLVPAHLEAL